MTPMIDAIVHELLDGLAGRTEVEFVRDFSHPLPMMVIADLIGVPRLDLARFKAWSDAIVEPFSMMVSPERELECARLVVEMQHYFAGLLEERRSSPRDDLLTAVVAGGGRPEAALRHARATHDPDDRPARLGQRDHDRGDLVGH